MDFTLPKLRSIQTEQLTHHDPEQRAADNYAPLPDPQLMREHQWYANEIETTDRFASPNLERIPFLAPNYLEIYERYRNFQRETASITHLSDSTGLLAYAYGNLWPHEVGFGENTAINFLQAHAQILCGYADRGDELDDVHLRRARRTRWLDGSGQIAFQQVNYDQIPIAGAQLVVTFDSAGQIAMVHNSLLPATLSELPTIENKKPPPEQLWEAVNSGINKDLGRDIVPYDLQWVSYNARDQQPFELWILPWAEGGRGAFFAAYRIFFVDVEGHHWAYWTDDTLQKALWLENRESFNLVSYAVFPHPGDAPHGAQSRALDLGGAADRLRLAWRVHTEQGARFYDPVEHPDEDETVGPQYYLAANVFNHLYELQVIFSHWFGALTEDAVDGEDENDRAIASPVNDLSVDLIDSDGGGIYVWDTGGLQLYRGRELPPRLEPAFDGSVIDHEATHAMLHYTYRTFFENSGIALAYRSAARALDEGLSYFYACVQLNEAQWGGYMLSGATPIDLAGQADTLAQITANTSGTGATYTYARWWAQVLWSIYEEPTLRPILPFLLLQTLHDFAQAVSTVGSGGDAGPVTLGSAFTHFAETLCNHAKAGNERATMKAIFQTYGFDLST